jgi:hypothetical protein
VWLSRAVYPLPFIACVFLALTSFVRRLHAEQWLVMGAYVLYIVPYIGVSYYDRYGVPLVAIKALLVIWAIDRAVCFAWPPRDQ